MKHVANNMTGFLALQQYLHCFLFYCTNGIQVVDPDFRKAFGLIDHKVLLENCCKFTVRPTLIGWLSSYLAVGVVGEGGFCDGWSGMTSSFLSLFRLVLIYASLFDTLDRCCLFIRSF